MKINLKDSVVEIRVHGRIKRDLEIKRLTIRKHYVVEAGVGAVCVGTPQDCLDYARENGFRHAPVGQNPRVTR